MSEHESRFRALETRIQQLEAWNEHLRSIYDIQEVLRWRKMITAWDIWLDMRPLHEAFWLCFRHCTPLPEALAKVCLHYAGISPETSSVPSVLQKRFSDWNPKA